MSQFEIIGTPAMRVFKRYVIPFSEYSASQATTSNVEGERVVRNIQLEGSYWNLDTPRKGKAEVRRSDP
jgi:hypothetical protein